MRQRGRREKIEKFMVMERGKMSNQVARVRRETLLSCMRCPLCDKLLKEATTISLCLHTFCRKCIYEKLSDEEVDCCPVCNIDLGCIPVEKLRPDHNLQDIRAKIFPFRRKKITTPEIIPSNSLPLKRKERSLSSLVVSTPKVSTQTGLTGKRTKTIGRKSAALRGSRCSFEDPVKKEEDPTEECPESSRSPDILNKIIQNKRQLSTSTEPCYEQETEKDVRKDIEFWEGNVDLWKPLNCLVEAANRTKTSKLNSQSSSPAKSEPLDAPDFEVHMPKTKGKEHGQKSKVQDDKNATSMVSAQSKRRRFRVIGRKRAAGVLSASSQAILDAKGAKWSRKNSPIWFSLVASDNQAGDIPLPQISACYLRIKLVYLILYLNFSFG
ncbi:unnamed protein product [Ilex paraguariensis]|uniref:RING-type domain-containing protein n=1 Tax=Ilex paraguariensis TaxID=185542 RepID=A0ABC8QU21_9AQUA